MSWSGDETLASGSQGERKRSAHGSELPRGTAVDRYVVTSMLGAGGMGVVYAAYDPELDRKVALKFLHGQGPDRGAGRQKRLLREAQALAKLAHPNVVAVYDVGSRGEDVWLAMEFVAGKTIARWLEQPRSWSEILSVFIPAAKGLAAAHAAGLVHRDVKPANVMLGDDGRVRVMDFGLARGSASSSTADVSGTKLDPSQSFHEPITIAGQLLGTPAYMAPEQLKRAPAGPESDQFSWCVMLWEALYGERPFQGQSLVEVAAAMMSGTIEAPTTGGGAPRWLRGVLRRGLAADPESRWPSLDALLRELARAQTRTRRRRAGVVLAGVTAAAGIGYGVHRLDLQRRVTACERAGRDIDGTWSAEAKSGVRAALIGTGIPHAATTADRIAPWLDAYAGGWAQASADVCIKGTVDRAWPDDVIDRAQWCLETRRSSFAAVIEQLSSADAEAANRAGEAAANLRELNVCVQREALERLPMPPADELPTIRQLQGELSRAAAMQQTGNVLEARQHAEDTLRRAEELGWAPLTAAARFRVGWILMQVGEAGAAEVALEDAFFSADGSGATQEAFAAARHLAHAVGRVGARPEEGMRWARHAANRLADLHDREGLQQADLWETVGLLHSARGEYGEAATLHERVFAIREEALGPRHPLTASALNNLGGAHFDNGDHAQGEALYEQAREIYAEAYGDQHPAVARLLNNLGRVQQANRNLDAALELHAKALKIARASFGDESVFVAKTLRSIATAHFLRGDYDEAERLYEQALPVYERAVGEDNPLVAMTLNELANIAGKRGDHQEAIRLRERALGILEGALGNEHPNVAFTLNNLATSYRNTDKSKAAEALGRAVEIWTKAHGPDHPYVAAAQYNLGDLKRRLGHMVEAESLLRRALATWESKKGAEHADLGYPLVSLAELTLAGDRASESADLAERALKVRQAGEVTPAELADARVILAQALVALDPGSSRATELAERARDAYREAGRSATERLAATEAWLAKR